MHWRNTLLAMLVNLVIFIPFYGSYLVLKTFFRGKLLSSENVWLHLTAWDDRKEC